MSEVVNCQDVFVRNVKNLMIKHKLNQYTLADKVGLSQTGLRLILIGESNPTLKTMTAICDALMFRWVICSILMWINLVNKLARMMKFLN